MAERQAWAEVPDLSPQTFATISFDDAHLESVADFGNRQFSRTNRFTRLQNDVVQVCPMLHGVAALALETLQKLLALVGYFLMGLALRNLFKMK